MATSLDASEFHLLPKSWRREEGRFGSVVCQPSDSEVGVVPVGTNRRKPNRNAAKTSTNIPTNSAATGAVGPRFHPLHRHRRFRRPDARNQTEGAFGSIAPTAQLLRKRCPRYRARASTGHAKALPSGLPLAWPKTARRSSASTMGFRFHCAISKCTNRSRIGPRSWRTSSATGQSIYAGICRLLYLRR